MRRATNRPAEAEEYIDRVLKVTERAADLCLQLLAYSGKGKSVLETVDIGELVLDSEQLLRVSVAKTIHIEGAVNPHDGSRLATR